MAINYSRITRELKRDARRFRAEEGEGEIRGLKTEPEFLAFMARWAEKRAGVIGQKIREAEKQKAAEEKKEAEKKKAVEEKKEKLRKS